MVHVLIREDLKGYSSSAKTVSFRQACVGEKIYLISGISPGKACQLLQISGFRYENKEK
jgi:hypothetical protein